VKNRALPELDRADRLLLAALQENARLTVAELAERVSLTPSPCWRRLKRLEAVGLIRAYHATLSAEKLGYGVTVFVDVMMGDYSADVLRRFKARLADIPEIVSCHYVSGRSDFLLQVVAVDVQAYGEFALNVLLALPGVKEIYSNFSMDTVKEGHPLPIPGG